MPRRPRGRVAAAVAAVAGRLHRDERGQSLAIILALITVLFLMGSALAAHTSVALRSTVANEAQAGDLNAADAGAELGMWWQRNGNAGNPPNITMNTLTVSTTVGITGAVPCPTFAATELTGFEHGVVSVSGGGLFATVTGIGVTADSVVHRTGGWSLDITDPTGANSSARILAAGNVAVFRLYLRLAALPAANVTELLTGDAVAGNELRLGYQAASRKLTLGFGAAVTPSALAVVAGTWYQVDLRFTANTPARTGEWQIDGVAQTPVSSTETGSTVGALRLGSTVNADAYNVNFDDVLISMRTGDYPVGAGTVVALRPDGMGTHSPSGAPAFRNDDGSAIDANTWTRLDGDPMSAAGAYVRQQTVATTSYVEVTMEDAVAPCIVGVSGLLAYHSQTATANNGKTSFVDGALESPIFSGDMSEATIFYKSAIVGPAAGSWTTGAVNGLTARIGYSTDVTPNPYWDGVLLEVATGNPAVPGKVTVTATAGNSTVTTTYTDVGAASPTLLSWSTTR